MVKTLVQYMRKQLISSTCKTALLLLVIFIAGCSCQRDRSYRDYVPPEDKSAKSAPRENLDSEEVEGADSDIDSTEADRFRQNTENFRPPPPGNQPSPSRQEPKFRQAPPSSSDRGASPPSGPGAYGNDPSYNEDPTSAAGGFRNNVIEEEDDDERYQDDGFVPPDIPPEGIEPGDEEGYDY